jgi:hypothetical protein
MRLRASHRPQACRLRESAGAGSRRRVVRRVPHAERTHGAGVDGAPGDGPGDGGGEAFRKESRYERQPKMAACIGRWC